MESEGGITRKLRIGGVSKLELLSRLSAKQVKLNDFAQTLFASDFFNPIESEIEIITVEVSVMKIGFPDGATFPAIAQRAESLGLLLAPIEVGPHLRIEYTTQVEGKFGYTETSHRAPPNSVTIASSPLSEDDSVPKGFYLRRIDGELWLRGYVSSLDHVWSPEDRLILSLIHI